MNHNSDTVVLITGGSGLVGKAIQCYVEEERSKEGEFANDKWYFASSKDADLTSYKQTKALFDRVKPTHVINLAAKVGGLYGNIKGNLVYFRMNMAMTENVLRCANECNVGRVISLLSVCIFPNNTTYPINETMIQNGAPHSSNFGYSYAKRMVDELNKCYNQAFGRRYVSLIPTNVFGPHDNYNLDDGHVIPGFIHKMYNAKRQGTPFTIWGTGRSLRQFIYSKDLARLVIWALRHYPETEPLLLCGENDEISITQAAKIVAKSMGYEKEILYDTSKADGQHKRTIDNSKLRKYLPDFKFTPIEEALKVSCDWFVENYETARK